MGVRVRRLFGRTGRNIYAYPEPVVIDMNMSASARVWSPVDPTDNIEARVDKIVRNLDNLVADLDQFRQATDSKIAQAQREAMVRMAKIEADIVARTKRVEWRRRGRPDGSRVVCCWCSSGRSCLRSGGSGGTMKESDRPQERSNMTVINPSRPNNLDAPLKIIGLANEIKASWDEDLVMFGPFDLNALTPWRTRFITTSPPFMTTSSSMTTKSLCRHRKAFRSTRWAPSSHKSTTASAGSKGELRKSKTASRTP